MVCLCGPQRSQFADKMAPKADVEGVVNPIHPLEDDDDPFLVRHRGKPAQTRTISFGFPFSKFDLSCKHSSVLSLPGIS